MSTKKLSLAVLAATTAALAACSGSPAEDDAAEGDNALSVPAALGGGCAFGGAPGQMTMEFIRQDRVLITLYHPDGRTKDFAREVSTANHADGSLVVYGGGTGNRPLFELKKDANGSYNVDFKFQLSDYQYQSFQDYKGAATCSLTAPASVPALPNVLQPAPAKDVPQSFAFAPMPMFCSATTRNAAGDLVELSISTGSDQNQIYVKVLRYDENGHTKPLQIVNAKKAPGKLELTRSYYPSDVIEGQPFTVTIGEMAVTPTTGGQNEVVLTANRTRYPSGSNGSDPNKQSLADAIGAQPIAFNCK
jgi:hypothetical protein